MALSPAQRSRRYRARLRGEDVPRGRPGRPRFTPDTPEELLGQLLGVDPQRLRDLESAVTSRGMTLSQFVEARRAQLPYGQQPQVEDTDEPLDPATEARLNAMEAILNFDFGGAEAGHGSVTRGGTAESLRSSGVDNPHDPAPCVYCSKPTTRYADGRAAHTVCEGRATRRASRNGSGA